MCKYWRGEGGGEGGTIYIVYHFCCCHIVDPDDGRTLDTHSSSPKVCRWTVAFACMEIGDRPWRLEIVLWRRRVFYRITIDRSLCPPSEEIRVRLVVEVKGGR